MICPLVDKECAGERCMWYNVYEAYDSRKIYKKACTFNILSLDAIPSLNQGLASAMSDFPLTDVMNNLISAIEGAGAAAGSIGSDYTEELNSLTEAIEGIGLGDERIQNLGAMVDLLQSSVLSLAESVRKLKE